MKAPNQHGKESPNQTNKQTKNMGGEVTFFNFHFWHDS